MTNTSDFRLRLIEARQRLGLSPGAMAVKLMTPLNTLRQWESGHRRTPGIAVKAAEAISPPPKSSRMVRRDQIVALADGSRTAAEIGAILGIKPRNVEAVIWRLRKAGRDVPRRYPIHRYSSRNLAICEAVRSGETMRSVAAAHGLSIQRVHKIFAGHGS